MMDNGLFGFVKDHIKEARLGGILGGLSSGTLLFTSGGHWYNLVTEWLIRAVFTILIAIASAIATAWAKDLYENYKATKKQKDQEHERRKKDAA
jgi:hypothetical protein